MRARFSTRSMRRIVAGSVNQPYTVAPDGKRFLAPLPVGGSQPLEVVVNWTALLKKGAAAE